MDAHTVQQAIVEVEECWAQQRHQTGKDIHLALNKIVDNTTNGQCEKSEGYNGDDIEIDAIVLAK